MTEKNRVEKPGVVVTAYPKLCRVEAMCFLDKDRAKVLDALRGIAETELRIIGAAFILLVRGDGATTHHVAISARNALRDAGIELAK